jgi:hypothetical protein
LKLETGATTTEIQGGANDEDLEDPTFDSSYTEQGSMLAEEEHEMTVDLIDEELVKWEKEQRREMEDEEEEEDVDDMDEEGDGRRR